MERSTNRILTTHVGSLVKTPEVIDQMRAQAMGEPFDEDTLAKHLRTGVAQVVRKQAEVGVDVPSDGEYGKSSWMGYVWDRISGLEPTHQLPTQDGVNWFTLRAQQFPGFHRAYDRFETTVWMPDLPSGKNLRTPTY